MSDQANTPVPTPAVPAAPTPAASPAPAPTPAAAPTPTPTAQPAVPAAAPAANPLAAKPAVSLEPAPAAAPPVPTLDSPYEPTGNAAIDAVVAGLHKAGADVERLSDALMASGKVDTAVQAALEKAYGKEVAAALKVGVEGHLSTLRAQAEAATQEVHNFFGGQEGWTAAQQWAKDNLSADVKAMLSTGLNQGGEAMKLALNQLKGLMEQAGQTVTGTVVTPGAPAPAGNQEIKFSEYAKEKLAASRRGDTQAVAALEARARASIDSMAKRGLRWRST